MDPKPGFEDRYSNLYRKKPEYPVTCEQDCYPDHPALGCAAPMEKLPLRTIAKPSLTWTPAFTVKWLGHASFLLQSPDGQQLLFDPVSGQFDWPVNWAFRLSYGQDRKPGAPLSDADWPTLMW